ncbi:Glutamate receptor ionotropic, kainate 4 [Chionoecetes opilio]|uniref:Glutamate receptor ionotropic, kainate 4 n=1 Tax=Chionoecetes opilio TaxID=41210 RepID=A0A8J4Y0J1_CHIOP|nr:Glutamate receptor ionotropic, kainate 4 [Chionoecetes opilio]
MGVFVAQFVKVIGVTEVYLCIAEGTGFNNAATERIIAATLARRTIFYMPCDMKRMGRASDAIAQGTTTEAQTPTALQQPAALHLISHTTLEATLEVLRVASIGWGTLIGLHILLGADLPDCQVFLGDASSHWYQGSYSMVDGSVRMEEMFLFGDSREALRVPVVSWSPTRGLKTLHEPGVGPNDFQGHALNVITIPDSPNVMEMSLCEKNETAVPSSASSFMDRHTCSQYGINVTGGTRSNVVYSGYLVEIILTLASSLNFTVRLSTLPKGDAVYGEEVGEGNYSGLIGALQSQRADIAMGTFSITSERLRVVDFSGSVGYSGSNLYAQRNASLETIGWDTFVLSFHWATWMAILMLLAIMAAGLWLIVHHQAGEDDHFSKGGNLVFILFSCLVQQGSWILPTTSRVQAVLWMFWVTSVVLYASYTAVLTSFLTVSTVTPPFTTLEEAVREPGWRIGILKGTAVPKILQRSKTPSYHEVYNRLVADPSLYCYSQEEGIQRMLTDSKFSFFGDRHSVNYLIRDDCSIKEMTGSYVKGYVHMAFRKMLPFAKVINNELLRLESGGVLDRAYQQWWGKPVPCEAPSPFTQLGFSNILTAFLLLLAGMVVSSVIFALELLYTSHRAPPIPSQTIYDRVELLVPRQPTHKTPQTTGSPWLGHKTEAERRGGWHTMTEERYESDSL